MAVHDKGKGSQHKPAGYERQTTQGQPQGNQGYAQQEAPNVPPGGAQANYQPGAGAKPHPRSGLSGINEMLRRSGSSERSETRSAEALRALREMSQEAIETQALADDHQLLRFDRDQNRVGLSSVLVVKTVKTNGKNVACVRPLLLETSDVRLPTRKIPSYAGGQRIEIPTRPQDVYNDSYWNRITEFLRRTVNDMDMIVVDAGPLVVPESFQFKNEVHTKELLITSVNRCDDAIAKVVGEEPLNIMHIKRDDERLTARLDFTGDPTHDVTGQPVRSDIVVTMSRQATNVEQEEDYYQSETELNSVSCFVNLEYTPQLASQGQPQGIYGQQQATQLFTPTVVISGVRNAGWIRANTPELYMLAISNAYRVTANTAWAKVFLPRVGVKGVDMRDIGALGYLATGTPAPTKSDTFEDKDFVELMQALVLPKPSFLIDVNPVGDNSAVENYFIDAAYEGPHRAQAIQAIVSACDNLTDGRFSTHFNAAETPIVVPYGQEAHVGSYVGPDGEERDIRDLDVLAMLNLTEGNRKEFEDWYSTWCTTNEPFEVRMQRREQLERHYLSKSLKITGRAVRLMLTPAFVDALDAATYEAGVMVEMENVSNIMGAQRFMGNQMVTQYTVQGNARMGSYANPNANRGHNYQAGVTGSGRYY